MTSKLQPITVQPHDRRYKLRCSDLPKLVTLRQCFEWTQRNHDASYPVITRLFEEVEELQALLKDVTRDLNQGYYISYQARQNIEAYFSELDKS